jgi:hypothetical protein
MDPRQTSASVQNIIDLVHRRDVLVTERAKTLANLDAEIAQIDRALAAAGGLIAPETATPEEARQRSMNLRVRAGSNAEKVLLAIARNSRVSLGELAELVYGSDDDDSRHKTRSVLWNLKNTGRLSADVEVTP